MRQHLLAAFAAALALLATWPSTASAQLLGTFRWQLAPYCNVVALTVTRNGALYRLDGYDTQCGGGANRATVIGLAVVNPSGEIGLGFTIVTSPGGAPVHVDASLNLTTLNGTWRDSGGGQGLFVFTAAETAPGAPRPVETVRVPDGAVTTPKLADGAVTAAKINAAEVQRRIAGGCPGGAWMTAVGQDRSVTCAPAPTGGGDITGVTAGAGLTGGGTTGDVSLAVNFAGTGLSAAVARSDHHHGVGAPLAGNTAVGRLALDSDTPSTANTAVGTAALQRITNAGNTAVGANALTDATNARWNTALGSDALAGTTLGEQNTAVGSSALAQNTVGERNTAVGHEALAGLRGTTFNTSSLNTAIGGRALVDLAEGGSNVALGANAGSNLDAGSFNVYVDHPGVSTESQTTRIGWVQQRAFIAGVYGVTTGVSNAQAVVIDAAGQLGTISSSRRTKFDIADLATPVTASLQALRPVQFRYRQPFADGSTPLQYGLIAEEVDEVLPALVVRDDQGDPASVKYHELPTLLLADVQRLERERRAQDAEVRALRDEVAALRARLDAMPATPRVR